MIKINGVELGDLDIFDLEVAEKFERELEKVDEVAKGLQGLTMTEIIKTQCNAIFELFNNIFGEGTDKKLFGNKVNLMTCLKAFEELVSEMRKKNKDLERLNNKYSASRIYRK